MDGTHGNHLVIFPLEKVQDQQGQHQHAVVLHYAQRRKVEKNWMPFEHTGSDEQQQQQQQGQGAQLYVVYSLSPHVILAIDVETGLCTEAYATHYRPGPSPSPHIHMVEQQQQQEGAASDAAAAVAAAAAAAVEVLEQGEPGNGVPPIRLTYRAAATGDSKAGGEGVENEEEEAVMIGAAHIRKLPSGSSSLSSSNGSGNDSNDSSGGVSRSLAEGRIRRAVRKTFFISSSHSSI